MSKLRKQSFLKGALILAIANLVVKGIGALFKIPLVRFILESDGIAVYNAAYTIYNVLFMVATAGLPVAISKMISESVAKENFAETRKIVKISRNLLVSVGVAGTAILFFGARAFSNAIDMPSAAPAMMALSPALFFVAVMSVYRGTFQGMSNMVPTAVSEFIEAMGKLVIGLLLAYLMLPLGKDMSATGAILGVSTGACLGAIFLFLSYTRIRKELKKKALESKGEVSKSKRILSRLLQLAIPITIGSAVFTLASVIDLVMISKQLAGLGFDEQTRKVMYGYYSGYAVTMFNLPPTIITSLSISIMPAITSAIVAKKRTLARTTTETAVRITLLFALPCAVGMSVLSAPILEFAFDDIHAAGMLSVLSYGIIFVSLVMVTNSIIQALGKVWMPVLNMLIGGAVKVITNFILVGNINININGAPYGTVLCYVTTALLNLIVIHKAMHPDYSFAFVIKTIICSAVMGALAYFTFDSVYGTLGNSLSLIIAMMIGVISYLACLILFKTLRKEDVEAMPGSKIIMKLLGRFL